MPERNPHRRTTIPVKWLPDIVEWILANCSKEELEFMADFAGDRNKFPHFNSILTKLTDHTIYEVFYVENMTPEQLAIFRSGKRGEVAGLKAFEMACQAAREKLAEKKAKK
jgi:hypothetical protein